MVRGGWEWALWLFVVFCISGASAGGEGGQERTMLFNTRGLAVSTVAVAAGAGLYFASAAKRKLAFIAAQIEEKKLDAGVLLELICSVKQSRLCCGTGSGQGASGSRSWQATLGTGRGWCGTESRYSIDAVLSRLLQGRLFTSTGGVLTTAHRTRLRGLGAACYVWYSGGRTGRFSI